MRFDMIAFLCGMVVVGSANAFSLGLLPCRTLAVISLLVALAGAAAGGYVAGRRSSRKAVSRRSYTLGFQRGQALGRAERQSDIQRFLEEGEGHD